MTRLTKYDKEGISRAIMNDVPRPDKVKRRKDLQAAIVKLMSPECRKIYNRTPHALATQHIGDLIYADNWASRDVIVGDVSKDKIEPLLAPYKEEDKARADASRALHCAINACTTLKQLNDRLPEFKKYFPTEEKPVANLPALANVVADLSKLGWPKGNKQ